jgi:hypothetical protein
MHLVVGTYERFLLGYAVPDGLEVRAGRAGRPGPGGRAARRRPPPPPPGAAAAARAVAPGGCGRPVGRGDD